MGTELGITPVIIRGEELKLRGFGGTMSADFNVLKMLNFDHDWFKFLMISNILSIYEKYQK